MWKRRWRKWEVRKDVRGGRELRGKISAGKGQWIGRELESRRKSIERKLQDRREMGERKEVRERSELRRRKKSEGRMNE